MPETALLWAPISRRTLLQPSSHPTLLDLIFDIVFFHDNSSTLGWYRTKVLQQIVGLETDAGSWVLTIASSCMVEPTLASNVRLSGTMRTRQAITQHKQKLRLISSCLGMSVWPPLVPKRGIPAV